ncbi:cell division cycle- protein, partial [Podochytrium sp. JEL0797]
MFSEVLVAVHSKYCTPAVLLDVLLDLYDEFDTAGDAHAVQLRVCALVSSWVQASFEADFSGDAKMASTLRLLCAKAADKKSLKPFADTVSPFVCLPLLKKTSHAEYDSTTLTSNKKWSHSSIFADLLRPKQKSWCEAFLEIDPLAVASQLTYLESQIFCAIEPHHLFTNINASKRTCDSKTLSTVDTSVGHFNFISAWVVTRVLMGRKPKSRSKMISHFIAITTHLHALHNYNTLMSVISGLTSTPIERLKLTQSLVPVESVVELRRLQTLMSQDKLFARYRKEVALVSGPCVPYLGVMLRDLIYIDEGNKDFLVVAGAGASASASAGPSSVSANASAGPAGKEVNVTKALMLGEIVLGMQDFQARPHKIQRDAYILGMVLESTALTSE